ncbi:MAG: response regulator [Syntrophobacteraceae bacterium]
MVKRVLVVDDSNLMRHSVVKRLSDAGHEVVGKAKDGLEAVELYRELRPDIVTMDITMRGKDGITAAKEILALDPDARIIFYTLLDAAPQLAARLEQIERKKIVRKGDEEDLLRAVESPA